jgi:hypothetical protein
MEIQVHFLEIIQYDPVTSPTLLRIIGIFNNHIHAILKYFFNYSSVLTVFPMFF